MDTHSHRMVYKQIRKRSKLSSIHQTRRTFHNFVVFSDWRIIARDSFLISPQLPLRHVTQKGVKWSCSAAQQTAFNFDTVKAAISHDCIMAYYDPAKTTRLTVDASPYGLGAILSNIDQVFSDRTGSIGRGMGV